MITDSYEQVKVTQWSEHWMLEAVCLCVLRIAGAKITVLFKQSLNQTRCAFLLGLL